MDELTALREQMAAMKERLNRSNIINKNLMAKVMHQRSSWTGRAVLLEAASIPLLTLLFLGLSLHCGISVWFAIVFFVMCVIDTSLDYKTLRISPRWFSELDMLTLRKRLLHQKTLRKKHFLVSLPLALVWGTWFGFELLIKSSDRAYPLDAASLIAFGIVLCFSLTVGCLLAFAVYHKAQRTNDDLLAQLTDYETESL